MPRYVLPNDPALSAASITPNDSVDLPNYARMIYIGGGGTGSHIKLTTLNGDTVTLKNVPTGILMVQAKRIWSAGTSATDLVALW